MFPIIPIAAVAGLVGSGATLAWYFRLPSEKQEAADRAASRMALKVFRSALDGLSREQILRVLEHVERQFT